MKEKFSLIASNLRLLNFAVSHRVISELLDTSQNKISTSWTFLGLLRPTEATKAKWMTYDLLLIINEFYCTNITATVWIFTLACIFSIKLVL